MQIPAALIPTLYRLIEATGGYPVGMKGAYELNELLERRLILPFYIDGQSIHNWWWLYPNEIAEDLDAYHTEQLRRRNEENHRS